MSTTVINYHNHFISMQTRHKDIFVEHVFWLFNQTPPDRKEILRDVHLKSDIASPVDIGHIFLISIFK